MNQPTITTANTHPVDLEALRLQLEEDGKFYCDNSTSDEAQERLLHTLQTNDCREIVTAVVDCHDLADAFVEAGYSGHVDVLEAFINRGMNVDIKDQKDWTALMYASCNKHEQCVRFLLDYNVKVDLQDKNGYTALMQTSATGKVEIVEILLEKNVNPDLQDKRGMTALMYASAHGSKEVVQLLLNHNPDIELRNDDGKTALDLANNKEIKEMIRNHASTCYVLK